MPFGRLCRMSSRPAADGATFDSILEAVREHTHLLLGSTIGFSEAHWAQPSGLTGWTRSHVAAHLVENARGLVRVCQGLAHQRRTRMYPSHSDKMRAIERGALASGLQLQIQLDTTASELQAQLATLEGNTSPVELRAGDPMPANQIPLARLFEVVVHSVDLAVDDHEMDLASDIAVDLLAFEAERIGRRSDVPGILVLADEGFRTRLGAEGEFETVGGPAAHLMLWLARGIVTPRLRGAWDRTGEL